ncbi:VWA domain-containing protein [Paenibacillus terrae]|uniref:VWFA domain-containing protein n=1 Tax=Paenibacillus terrae TaxID=159743 RepID=A0A0D7WX76_9BACL|nr:VWA domain-containing protein [Paenibacillus terrae]KJD43786.1 hypothetical protein QD47_20825 [Paenibacillus terrae]
MINLEKAQIELINLSKKASISLAKRGLGEQKAKVSVIIDISQSMDIQLHSGKIQQAFQRLLALAMNFDDNGAADIFAFGKNDYYLGEIEQKNFFEFVDREILNKHQLEGGTKYAGVLKRVVDFYFPETTIIKKGFLGFGRKFYNVRNIRPDLPCFAMFITDGDCHDPEETKKIIRTASHLGLFIQFVGIGRSNFLFLDELDILEDRFIDNANFFSINDLSEITDNELYDRLLNEFPDWLLLAKQKGLII